MSTRNVDTAIRYAIDVTQKGLQQAVALTKDLSVQSKATQVGVDASMKAVQTQYNALAKVAASADSAVAKAAVDSASVVNKALDSQIAKLRETGASYSAIVAKQREFGVSAAELAAAVKRSSAEQIASMKAVRTEAERPIRRLFGNAELRSAERGTTRAVLPFGGLGGNVLAGGIASYASVEGIKTATESTIQRLNIAKQLQLAGLTSSESQTLAASTTAFGLNPNAAAVGLKALARQTTGALDLNNTGKTSAPAQAAFGALGISRGQLAGTSGDLYKTLGLVADKLQNGAHGAAQYAAASLLLGKGFASLNPLLRDGSKGLEEQAKWAEKYGLIAKGAGAAGLEALHHKQIELKFATMGLQQSIAVNLTPALLKILPIVGDLAHSAGQLLKPAIEEVSSVLGPVVTFFKSGSDEATALKAVMIGLGTAFGIYKVVTISVTAATKAWAAAQALLNFALDANPIGLVVLALAGLTAGLIYAYDHSTAFRQALGDAFTWIKTAAADSINFVIDRLNNLITAWNWVQQKLGPLGSAQVAPIAHVDFSTPAAAPVGVGGFTSNAGRPRHGGTFATGGLVPAMVSPGEMVVHGGMSAMVPGPRTAADSVFAMLPPGAAVMTGHGQALMGMGASLDEALAMQMPHFAAGGAVNALGWNVKAPGGRGGHGGRSGGHSRGSTATPRYLHNVLIGNFTTAGWHAYLLAHPSTSSTRALSHYGIPGLVGLAEGGGFSGENAAIAAAIAEAESGGDVHSVNTAGNSPPSRDRGLWQFNDYWNKNISDATAFDPFAAAKAAYQTFRSRGFRDWVTYNQGQYRRFLPAAEAALHSGVAPITSGTPQGVLQAAAKAKVGIPTLSNATASLTGQTAFAGGFQAGLSGLNLMDTVHSGILSQLLGDVAVTKSSSSPTTGAASVASSVGPRSGSYVFPLPDFGSEQRVDRGQDMESKRPYANTVALGSGTVTSATIGWPGMRLLLDSGAYKGQTVFYGHNNAMHARVGQHLRAGQLIGQVGNLSGGGDSRHTEIGFMGGYGSQSGHWVGPGSSGGMLMHRLLHQMAPQWIGAKAMRRGGVVGKHHHPAALNPITGANTKIGALLAQGDAANVDAAFTALAGSLDDAASFTQASLLALAQKVHSHSRKGLDTIQQRRLDTVMNLIDAALGNRVGLLIASAQDAVDTIARGNAHRVALSTLSGVDPGSTKGLQLAVQLDQAVLSGLNAQVGVLQRAKETAKKYGDKATIKTVTDQLNTALGNLDQAAVQAMNDWKASVERATQDAVDSASQAVSVAQAGEGILSLQQQLAGTDQTPGGGQATSAYISSTVIPALQAQLAAQQADQAAAASVGDTARVNQDILSELQTQTSILSEQKTAQDAIKANTTPLKTFGGQLAFQFQGSNFTDLAALAPGS